MIDCLGGELTALELEEEALLLVLYPRSEGPITHQQHIVRCLAERLELAMLAPAAAAEFVGLDAVAK